VIMLALSARSGALAARIGPRLQMSIGPVLIGAGLALAACIGPAGSYLTEVLPGVLVFGLGLAATVAPLTSTALAAAPNRRAGIASAINNDVARAAGLIAVAVLPAAAGITGVRLPAPWCLRSRLHHSGAAGRRDLRSRRLPRREHHPQPGPQACQTGTAVLQLRGGRLPAHQY